MNPWPGAFSITLIAIVLFCAIAVAIDSYRSKRKRDKETDEQIKAGLKKLVELGYVIESRDGYLPTVKGLRELERRQ